MEDEIFTFEELFKDINVADINIFEGHIDPEMQLEFMEHLLERKKTDLDDIETHIKLLFSETTGEDKKKDLIVGLVSSEEVKAFRAIEKFVSEIEDGDLKNWAVFALHEMKMKLQALFSDKTRVSVISQMGGKGNKLRHFCVFPIKKNMKYTKFRHEVIQKEIDYFFKKNGAKLEEITMEERFVSIVCLVPISILLENIFVDIIDSANEMGDFISEKCLITNTGKLSRQEIIDFLDEKKTVYN